MKNSKTLRAMCLGAAVLMSISALSGCENGGQSSTPSSSKDNSQADTPASSTVETTDSVYPIATDETIVFWEQCPLYNARYTNYGETEVAQELEKRTGIKVKYEHPASGMAQEQFNMLIASNELPDIVKADWYTYGGQKAIDEGLILNLSDVMDDWAPNFKNNVCSDPELDKMLKTDEGNYYAMPFIRKEERQCVYCGPIIRKDWLDELNLDVPETIDEWDTMLQAFKDKKGAEAPLAFQFGPSFGFLTGAYGVIDGYFVGDDGQIKYGPQEEGYRDWLTKMNEWFEKGLLDQNFATIDMSILDGYVLNDKTGATYGYAGSSIGSWLSAKSGDPSFALVGAKYPVLNKGDKPQFGQKDWRYVNSVGYAVSAKSKNAELAVRFLDYGYSEEGQMLYNYGIEGKSYEIKDGEPAFTEFITKNPDGLSIDTVLSEYAGASVSAPTIQYPAVQEVERPYAAQNEAVATWSDNEMGKHKLPLFALNEEENDALSTRITELDTFANEMKYAFITGNKPISEFDEYVEQLKAMGVDEVIATYGVALERYNNR